MIYIIMLAAFIFLADWLIKEAMKLRQKMKKKRI